MIPVARSASSNERNDFVAKRVEKAGAMLFQVARECLDSGGFVAEFGLGTDATALPAMGRETGAVGLQDAFGCHQVFIFVMMS